MTRDEKVDLVDNLIFQGTLDGLILADLTVSYDLSREEKDGWEMADALRKVIHHYSSERQYEEFKEDRGL
jgi:hypothetical protein